MGYDLDKYQMDAVKAEEKNVLIVAAPGSGKTTVIINRVDYLVERKRVANGNIIVITFTKAAAQNMKNRYVSKFDTNSSPFLGHSMAYFIRYF